MSPDPRELESPDLFISRQTSWLAFNRRVLDLAADERLPVLDRVRFLAIAGENLDGFFMKRVGPLKREIAQGLPRSGPWPSPAEELDAVREEARRLHIDLGQCLSEQLLPALADHGVRIVRYADLDDDHRAYLDRYFDEQLFPILTPLAVDPGRPFPFISNLSLSLAVVLRHENDPPLFARVKVPSNRPRFVPLPDAYDFVLLEEIIAAHLDELFRRMTILSAQPFRVTRSADVSRDDAAADDLMDFAAELVQERRFAPVVRLELAPGIDLEVRELLISELALEPQDVYEIAGLPAPADLMALANLDLPELKRPPWVPVPHPALPTDQGSEAIFAAIRERDILVHRPFHDYESTIAAFIAAAAEDDRVLAIKQSLYRTSAASPTLSALLRAAEAGKEVTALVELQARLDEASNLAWARRFERSGIHTSFGYAGFKTHTRITLVVRDEDDGLRSYVHFSTGDYNEVTAQTYTDVCLLTSRPEVGADALDLFNALTGYGDMPAYRAMIAAPVDMRQHLLDRIEREIEHQRAGRGGRVVAMMNALVDVPLTVALYRASQAGVTVDLAIRGECCLRPGLAGISDHIRVRSVLGPFLEHARIFRFANGGDDEVFISSADWMYRNLDHRIEAMIPVADPTIRAELVDVLDLYLADTAYAWELGPDGTWSRVRAAGEPLSAQEELMRRHQRQETSSSTAAPSIRTG